MAVQNQSKRRSCDDTESIKSDWVNSFPGHLRRKGHSPEKRLASGSNQLKDAVLDHQPDGVTSVTKRIADGACSLPANKERANKASV